MKAQLRFEGPLHTPIFHIDGSDHSLKEMALRVCDSHGLKPGTIETMCHIHHPRFANLCNGRSRSLETLLVVMYQLGDEVGMPL